MSAPKKYSAEQLMGVVLAPVVSEKSTMVGDKSNQVVFRVSDDATKPEVKAALYGGTLNGRVRLDYPARWVLAGYYAMQDIDVAALAKVFTPSNTLGGRLRSEGQFDARAASAAGA